MIAHQRFQGAGRPNCKHSLLLNSKDPRIKNPGVFCFPQGRMIDRKIKEAEYTRQHTLSPEQLKKLLEDKMARARQYYNAVLVKREMSKDVV